MTGGQGTQSSGPNSGKAAGGKGTVAAGGVGNAPANAAGKRAAKADFIAASRGIAWNTVLTGWPVRACLALATVGVWAWTIVVPFPKTDSVSVVSAREELNIVRENIAHQSTYASVDETQLSNLVVRAQEFLIPKRERIVGLTASIEKFAREQGLQADIMIKPVPEKDAPAPGVRVFAGTLRLVPTAARDNSPYERLLAFLDRLEGITEKVEVVGLTAAGDKGRMGSAQVEMQFWIKHEKSAAQ